MSVPLAGDALPIHTPLQPPPPHNLLPTHESTELQHLPTRKTNGRLKALPRIDTGDIPNDFEDEHDSSPSSPSTQMPRKSKSRSPNPQTRQTRSNGSVSSSTSSSASDARATSLEMSSSMLEQRRKPAIDTSDSAQQTAHLMGRSSFTLDDMPPPTPGGIGGDSSKGFMELPEQDRRNFLLLVLLYFLQGIPMGLAGGSVPFLLKSHLSYGQIGVYSLASYPYSLKLLWSPIVDAVWSPKVGRRKSWILPIQTVSGFGMIWLGARAERMMVEAGEGGVWAFTGWWFALVFMCATQDIAVDGELLRRSPQSPRSGLLLTRYRLGIDPSISKQSLLRQHCADSRSDCRPIPLIHRLPCP